jgi:hypothetical protein
MRCLVKFTIPVDVGNDLVRTGRLGDVTSKVIETIGPEVVYFTAENGTRGGTMVVEVAGASDIPRIAEPLFLAFEADVEIVPCMLPEELAQAEGHIADSAQKFG